MSKGTTTGVHTRLKRGEARSCGYWLEKLPLTKILKCEKQDRRHGRQAASAVSRESAKMQSNQDKDLLKLKAHLKNVEHATNLNQKTCRDLR
eukprot:9489790-Pyramimonas_sp.AAC.1